MQVLSVRALALAAAAAAALTASTTASNSTSTSTSTATAASLSGASASASATTTGSVSCVFRYSMPTASNIPSEVAAAAKSSTTSTSSSSTSGSSTTDGSAATSGSVGDGSTGTAGTVHTPDGSDSSAMSDAGDGSSSSSSTTSTPTPTPTTKTPTSTTATPSSTTKTPSTTTATPTSTTKTPTSTTRTPTSTTATPSTSTTDGSTDDDESTRRRRLAAEAGAATSLTSTVSSTAANATAPVTGTTTSPSLSSSSLASSSSSSGSSATSSSSPSASGTSTTTTTTSLSGSSAWSSSSSSSAVTTTTVEFTCDAAFYSAWSSMKLTCDGTALDVDAAAAQTQCLIYSGTADGTGLTDLATCLSVCRFPACNNGTWDYTADDGINSDIYADLDLLTLLTYAGESAAVEGAVTQPFSNLTMSTTSQCDYTSDSSFSACQCDNYVVSGTASGSSADLTTASSQNSAYTVPKDKGLEDSDHWADGTTKTTVDKAGIASTAIGSSAATVSVVAGGVMSVASGIVGGTSAGVASGVSAAASVSITMAAVDLCQFSVMINQMNVDARPRFLENMGKKMSASSFQFLPFGKTPSSSSSTSSSSASGSDGSASSSGSSSTRRRLGSSSASASSSSSGSSSSNTTSTVQGMEKYADLIGVQADMLFYLTVAGIGCLIAALFICYAIAMGAASFFVSDFPAFRKKWLDKAIGVLMMILILSEYAIGATAMYQICYCIDNSSIDASFVLAIVALLVMAFGTILFGILVIRNNEEELRDLGTKHHFDKKFHARFGPLYDEYSFEGRFFFAPKLMLALLCGMTTGMVWIQGLWQIIVLIGFHIAFLFYLEMKQPYPTAFVQKTSSFVIIIKISALFLSFFLLSSATSFNEDIPDDLREGVGFAIVGLQVLVLVALMIRQVYIFYRTWKLKRDGGAAAENDDDDKAGTAVVTTNNRDGANDPFFSLGEPNRQFQTQQAHNQQQQQQMSYRENSVVMLGDDAYGYQQQQQHQQALRGLQPPAGRRTASVVVHDGPGGYRSNEVSL